jgi:hypothetical protein
MIVRKLLNRITAALPLPTQTLEVINQYYVTSAPSPQNALDIFAGEWSSQLPPPFDHLKAGSAALFDDARVKWWDAAIGGFRGKQVLELGPLEGGHTFMLEHLGAATLTAIEANTHAFLKCLIVKELLGMRLAQFQCGDFVEFMRHDDCPTYDIGLASGVLYHMDNPVELMALLASRCRSHILLWTHYYDEDWVIKKSLRGKFPFSRTAEHMGFKHTLYHQEYGSAGQGLGWRGFCGGSQPHSSWLTRNDILDCLRHFGFGKMQINFDHYDHPNGPAFALAATKGH